VATLNFRFFFGQLSLLEQRRKETKENPGRIMSDFVKWDFRRDFTGVLPLGHGDWSLNDFVKQGVLTVGVEGLPGSLEQLPEDWIKAVKGAPSEKSKPPKPEGVAVGAVG